MIDVFKEIVEVRGWAGTKREAIMQNMESRLSRRLPQGVPLTLTAFQKKVLASPDFWRDWNDESEVRHLMIQGATSAGKTLVSELGVLDTLHHRKKAIVLVPLKAMVHERTMQFREDVGYYDPDCDIDVFAASSDYMEYDEQLIKGSYDVAIIVYEKFFAMLNQNGSRIMEDCGLLVVDELSMLSQEQRGPKLEMALEIVRRNSPETRIVCLVTCDCDTTDICKWLDIDKPIFSTARPVALEEHIIRWNGEGKYRVIPENYEHDLQEAPEEYQEKLDIPGYTKDWRQNVKERNLLLAVMNQLCSEDRGNPPKVLVFVGSQSMAAGIARFLQENRDAFWRSKNASGRTDREFENFLADLKACDRDEGLDSLINDLVPTGIVYHHAGLSTDVRELIEKEFQRPESPLNIIVATETLTVGVNMPFDAMVMVSSKVPRGMGDWFPLSRQEYRNYIGRAGRLGQNKHVGKTYLFVEDEKTLSYYWSSYSDRESLKSALMPGALERRDANKTRGRTYLYEKRVAPYYLSLLKGASEFTPEDIDQLYEESLSCCCESSGIPFDAQALCEVLDDTYMTEEIARRGGPRSKRETAGKKCGIRAFGTAMASYAFATETCLSIYWYFFTGYERDHGGIPLGITKGDIDADRYLLDILYHVCRHKEVEDSSNLAYPIGDTKGDRIYKAKKSVHAQLRAILEEKDENGANKYALWCDGAEEEDKELNEIYYLLNDENPVNEDRMLQAAMRAILLFYWTKGLTLKEIHKKTGFHEFAKVTNGDIERLAEVVSFHLDAIFKCLYTAGEKGVPIFETDDALRSFRALQTRVKYGMPRELVQFANKHIHGLDRARLLRLKQKADSRGMSPLQFLYIAPKKEVETCITASQKERLLSALSRAGFNSERDTLAELIARAAGSEITESEESALKKLAEWDREEGTRAFYENLRNAAKIKALGKNRISTDGESSRIVWELGGQEIRIGVLTEAHNSRGGQRADIRSFFREDAAGKILIVQRETEREEMESLFADCGCTAVMDNVYFALVIANAVRLELGSHTTGEFLADQRGIFTKADENYGSLSRYVRRSEERLEKPKFRLLPGNGRSFRDGGIFGEGALNLALSGTEDLNHYEELPWGSGLYEGEDTFTDCPTVICIDRKQIAGSESLNRFMARMDAQNYRNCLLLLTSQTDREVWLSAAAMEETGQNRWNSKYNKVRIAVVETVPEAVRAIRAFLAEWKHPEYLIGISYAHYDPNISREEGCCSGDIQKLHRLAQKLKEIYGEDRILYDRFDPARKLFPANRGREKALAAYGTCKVYLVLWNFWTEQNENCRDERDVILRRCARDEAACLFLQTGHHCIPKCPENYYSVSLEYDEDLILEEIREKLHDDLK